MDCGSRIPGLGDYSDSDEEAAPRNAPTEKHFLVIDHKEMVVKLASMPYSTPDSKLSYNGNSPLVLLTEEQYSTLGRKLDENELNLDHDWFIHCDHCDAFYDGMCKEHPFFWIQDRQKDNVRRLFQKEIPVCDGRAEQTKPLFIKIGQSPIPGAGKGCFATMWIPRGFVFGPYHGVRRDQPDQALKDGYCWEVRNTEHHAFIDASRESHSNWLRYINHSHTEEQQNVLAFQYNGSVYYRVVKEIAPTEEILVYYGENFAKDLLADHRPKTKVVNTIQRPKRCKRRAVSRNPFIL